MTVDFIGLTWTFLLNHIRLSSKLRNFYTDIGNFFFIFQFIVEMLIYFLLFTLFQTTAYIYTSVNLKQIELWFLKCGVIVDIRRRQ